MASAVAIRRDERDWLAPLITALAVASVVLVLGLWVHGGQGLRDLASAGTALTSLGRVTGLLSADLLLIQVLLMARVPPIERAYGRDALVRWHRLVGFTSIDLMLAHVVLITAGYAVQGRVNVFAEAWQLTRDYPGMLLAVAGTVALVVVALTSLRAARRRLRYESWHLLHLYAYLGVGLALPHELWTGGDFLDSHWATVYWWTAYAVAAGAIVAFRLVLPLWRSLYHRLRVDEVVPEGPGVVSVWLRGHALDRLPARAGQFFSWRFLTGPDWSRAHPYSLSVAPGRDRLRITVKNLGDDSALVARLHPGVRVLVEGPYGGFVGGPATGRPLTMLAAGIGITPLRALLEDLPYRPGRATLLYRAHNEADFTFRSELDALASARSIRVVYLPGPRARVDSWAPIGSTGDDVAVLRALVPDIADHEVYLCGPDGWMAAAARAVRAAGVAGDRLHEERFAW